MSSVPAPFPEYLVQALTAKLDDPDRLDDELVVAELAAQFVVEAPGARSLTVAAR